MDTNTIQSLVLKNRKELNVDGVSHVIGFDSEYVAVETNMGRLTVEGKGIIIDNLSKIEGSISICGEIDSIYYSTGKSKERGILSKLIK